MIDKELPLAFVGALSEDAPLLVVSAEETVGHFAGRLRQQHQQQLAQEAAPIFRKHRICYKGEPESYYSYCRSHRVRNYGRVRLVISHRQADLSDTPKFYRSNCLRWQAGGITRIARHRWPLEVYHEEGKAEGLDQYQIRDFAAIYRPIALVAVVYSLLRRAQYDRDLLKRLQRNVETALDGSLAAKRRQAQALWTLAVFISTALGQGLPLREIMAPMLRGLAY